MKNYIFMKGNLVQSSGVEFDVVAQTYTLNAVEGKVYEYTRRNDGKYDISIKYLWVTISKETPHIKGMYDKAEQNQQEIDEKEVAGEIEKVWQQYLSYALTGRAKGWVTMQESEFQLYKTRMTIDECIKELGISEEEFKVNMSKYSPY